jgi:thymidylate kinase
MYIIFEGFNKAGKTSVISELARIIPDSNTVSAPHFEEEIWEYMQVNDKYLSPDKYFLLGLETVITAYQFAKDMFSERITTVFQSRNYISSIVYAMLKNTNKNMGQMWTYDMIANSLIDYSRNYVKPDLLVFMECSYSQYVERGGKDPENKFYMAHDIYQTLIEEKQAKGETVLTIDNTIGLNDSVNEVLDEMERIKKGWKKDENR